MVERGARRVGGGWSGAVACFAGVEHAYFLKNMRIPLDCRDFYR